MAHRQTVIRPIIAALVVLPLLAACTAGLGPRAIHSSTSAKPVAGPTGRLDFPHGKIPPFGFGKSNTPAGQPVAINTATMCASGGAPAQIVSITLKDPENLALVDWGVRPYPPSVVDTGYWNGKVLDDPTFTQESVKAQCESNDLVELNVSARRTNAPLGSAHGFDVTTTAGTLFVPMRIVLCAATCPDDELRDLP